MKFLNETKFIWFVPVNNILSAIYSLIHGKLPYLRPENLKNGQTWPFLSSRFCVSAPQWIRYNFCIFQIFRWKFISLLWFLIHGSFDNCDFWLWSREEFGVQILSIGGEKSELWCLFFSFDFLGYFWRENGRGHQAPPCGLAAGASKLTKKLAH